MILLLHHLVVLNIAHVWLLLAHIGAPVGNQLWLRRISLVVDLLLRLVRMIISVSIALHKALLHHVWRQGLRLATI